MRMGLYEPQPTGRFVLFYLELNILQERQQNQVCKSLGTSFQSLVQQVHEILINQK